ncbi:MAG: hypothetical protein UT17_C0004G0183 [Candidatus Woesebacteria bacterium GW2011_GWB1_39_10]|uniref:Four helix bundle protein n=2 Tax=Candidatus Woeseibacteriota TaxID=1752722 RepID=A0A0G0LV07_9BACT|nr:MAG: hypothetical protein UT17_C0004G0183 [Candidatus Woesebacteria bacterium GW2011_GWB1_39_10]KKS90825.1 MAG: hypothetical protein UV66_C0001G0182 [Candidatus Woesebacteria bacterium GW2011_GWA1_43_12]
MGMIENKFEELKVWKEAHQLVIEIYKTTKRFPAEEKFRLIDQVCRSASSIAANIVEGNSRQHKTEYLQFLYMSNGSLEETKYHLLLAKDLNYVSTSDYEKLIAQCNVVGSLLGGLIKYVKLHRS